MSLFFAGSFGDTFILGLARHLQKVESLISTFTGVCSTLIRKRWSKTSTFGEQAQVLIRLRAMPRDLVQIVFDDFSYNFYRFATVRAYMRRIWCFNLVAEEIPDLTQPIRWNKANLHIKAKIFEKIFGFQE